MVAAINETLAVSIASVRQMIRPGLVHGFAAEPQGPSIASGATALAVQLKQLLPEEDIIGPDGEVVRKGTGLSTLPARIRAVQKSVKLQRQFFQGDPEEGVKAASFEKKVGGVIRQLLTDTSSQVAREFDANRTGLIKSDQSAVRDLRRIVDESTPQLSFARARSGLRAIQESMSGDAPKLRLQLGQETISLAQSLQGYGSRNFLGNSFRQMTQNIDTFVLRDVIGTDPLKQAKKLASQGVPSSNPNAQFINTMLGELQGILREAQDANAAQLREMVNEIKNLSSRDNHRGSAPREMNRGRR